MSTHTWHTDEDLLGAYLAGRLDALRGRLGRAAPRGLRRLPREGRPARRPPDLALAWAGVQAAVERPAQPLFMRLARRLGLSEPTSVLLTAYGVAADRLAESAAWSRWASPSLPPNCPHGKIWPFLLVAPLVPVIGVAASYGPSTDPLETLIVTSPYGRDPTDPGPRTRGADHLSARSRCLLGLMLPGPLWIAAAWLGPALAMIPVLLAVASFVGPRAAAGVLALSWSAVVLASTRRLPATGPSNPTGSWSSSPWRRPPSPYSPCVRAGPARSEPSCERRRPPRGDQEVRRHGSRRRCRPHLRPRRDRPAGPQRCRQDDAAADRRHLHRPRPRRRTPARARPAEVAGRA